MAGRIPPPPPLRRREPAEAQGDVAAAPPAGRPYEPPAQRMNITISAPGLEELGRVLMGGLTGISDQLAGLQATFTGINERIDTMSQTTGSGVKSVQDALDQLTQQVSQVQDVDTSIQTYVNGLPNLIATAVAEAQAQGATPEQLQAFTTLRDTLQQNTSATVDAIKNAPQQSQPQPGPAPTPPQPGPGPVSPADPNAPVDPNAPTDPNNPNNPQP